jgi:hypothetical protein
MIKKPKPKPVKIINPRYKGATPGMVALALMKHRPKEKGAKGKKPLPVIDDSPARSSI